MKKRIVIIMIAVMLAIPAAVFAGDGLSFGGTAYYDSGLTLAELENMTEPPTVNPEDLLYGAEVRLDLSIFQINAMAMYNSLSESGFGYLNAGLYLDLGIIGMGVTAGPGFGFNSFDGFGLNGWYDAKVNADLILGPVILSAYVMGETNMDPSLIDGPEDLTAAAGVSALFQL